MTNATNQGARAGAKVDEVKDNFENSSYRDIGRGAGKRVDAVAKFINENVTDSNGKKLDECVEELYNSTSNLAGRTYDYAWSWVPFTEKKAKSAKGQAEGKAEEIKAGVKKNYNRQDVDPSLGSLIDESRALVGQVLSTVHDYVIVADKKSAEVADDAQGSDNAAVREAGGLIHNVRGMAASLIKTAENIVTYGQDKADELASKDGGDLKKDARKAKDDAKDKVSNAWFSGKSKAKEVGQDARSKAQSAEDNVKSAGTDGERPGFKVELKL